MTDSLTVERLELEVGASATGATKGIDELASSLAKLDKAMSSLAGAKTPSIARLNQLTSGLSKLNRLQGLKISSTIGNSLKTIATATASLNGSQVSSISKLSKALPPLSKIEKPTGLQSTISQLNRLPKMAQSLAGIDWNTLTAQIGQLSNALAPLSRQMSTIATGFSRMPTQVKQVARSANTLSQANGRASTSYINLWAKARMAFNTVRWGASALASCIKSSNDYVENLNLFTVSMGKYAGEAQKYAESVGELMGIDPSTWMRYQGVFQTITEGFGVASDRAYVMSKNLSQLGYDLSSFFNISVEDAMTKLESGISGELEPLRRLGYDLSQARLKAEALSLGIDKSFESMTQAEKAQLRYHAILTQVTTAQGDMARTLDAPANQLRVLKAQFTQCARAIGNVFIPILNKILPYVTAVTRLFKELMTTVAGWAGFELPTVNYDDVGHSLTNVTDGTDALGDSLESANESARKLHTSLAGFDQLNVIASESGGSGAGGASGASGGWSDFDLPEYDFLSGLVESRSDEILEKMRKKLEKFKPIVKWIKDNFDKIKDVVFAIGLGFGTWKLIELAKGLSSLSGVNKLALGLTLGITGLSLEFGGMRNIGAGKAETWDYIKAGLGAAFGVAGSILAMGSVGAGLMLGIPLVISVGAIAFNMGKMDALQDDIEAQFLNTFSGAIDPKRYEEVLSQKLSDITVDLDSHFKIQMEVEADREKLEEITSELDKYNRLVMNLGGVTKEQTELATESLKSFVDIGGKYIEDSNKLLQDGLIASLKVLPDEAAKAVSGYLSALEGFEDEDQKKLKALSSQYEGLLQRLSKLDESSPEYAAVAKDITSVWQAMQLLTGQSSDLINVTAEVQQALTASGLSFKDLDFGSMDDVTAFFDEVNKIFEAERDKINQWYADLEYETQLQIDAFSALGDTGRVETLRATLETYKLAHENYLKEITKNEEAFYGDSATHLLDYIGDLEDKAVWESFGEKNFEESVDKKFASYASAYSKSLKEIQKIWRDSDSEVAQEFASLFTEPIQAAEASLTSGSFDFTYKFRDNFNRVCDDVRQEMAKKMSEFEDDQKTRISKASKDMANTFVKGVGNTLSSELGRIADKLYDWWGKLNLPVPKVSGHVDTGNWHNVPIPKFAGGGYPQRGSLFLAGEGGGAELVGSMGGKTAVANSGQIVQGIAAGVERANHEQNALLREQNSLLRQLLAQGGNVVFSPSPEAGRAVHKSLVMFEKQRGY